MVAARLTGCFSREDIRRVVSLRYGIDPARRQPAPLRQCPVRRAFSERYRKALLAQRHPPVGRRHGHPRHARHGRRQNGLRRTPVRAALRLHRRWSLRLDITAYGPLSGHKYATRPERRRAGRAVLEVGAVRKPRSLCRKRAPSGRRAGQSHPLYPKKIRTIQIHYRK